MATRTVTTVGELKELVGQELGVGPWLRIAQERVDAYADVSGDYQWIHVEPERAARESSFGGTIAHGFLTLSLIPLLMRESAGIAVEIPRKMAINYGVNRVRFPSPVRVGTRVRLRTHLQAVDEIEPSVWHVIYRQTVEIEGEPKPAMVAETIIRLYL